MVKEEQEYRSIESRYRRDTAILNARPKLVIGGFIFWTMLDISLLLVFVFGVMLYIVSGTFTEAIQTTSLIQNVRSIHTSVVRAAPIPLEMEGPKSASVSQGKYDLYATVQNLNANWYTTFDYVFTYAGGETEVQSGFLNPSDRRLLPAINVLAERRPTSVRLVLRHQAWHRVDKHQISSTAQFLADRANLTVDQASYGQDVTVGNDQLGRSTIVITNRSGFAYWNPEFLVKLMRGSTIISLTKVSAPKFLPSETRALEVRWFGTLPPSGTLGVESVINYFDKGVYMDPDDESGQDVRR